MGKGLASIGVCCLGAVAMYLLDDFKHIGLILPIIGVVLIWVS